MSIAKVGDINLYYEFHGKGEPLVLIMGYGVSHIGWFLIQDKLASEHRVIVFDNRGTGRSDKPEMPYTAKMMAADVAGLLDVLDISAASVFGHSMGGMIAQEFALNYPDRLSTLILGGTTCGGSRAVPPTAEAMAFLFDPELAKLPAEARVRATIPWAWNKEFVDNNPAAIERFIALTSEYPTPPQARVSQQNALMTHDTYDRLPDIKAPTLVIAGSKDRLVPFDNSKLLASRIPNAEVAIIENAGHEYFDDSAEKSSKIILDFLRRHSKAGAKN
jgi:pimeloyl-ACP methyl ester carboxylesterase